MVLLLLKLASNNFRLTIKQKTNTFSDFPVGIYLKAAAKIGHFSEERIQWFNTGLVKVDDFMVNKNKDDSDKDAVKQVNLYRNIFRRFNFHFYP